MARAAPKVTSLAAGIKGAERSELIELHQHYRSMGNEWLKRMIRDHDRIDILAATVLGYEVKPLHLAILQWQFKHVDNIIELFRGSGKSTIGTVTKIIHLLIKNPELRIVICSKTAGNAEGFLKEIKGHLEDNSLLNELFGPFYDPRKVAKWDNREIEIMQKTKRTKEASITCVGVDSTIVSKHYDVEISDDLVDEENSRTKHMRERTKSWYYTTLDPTIEPPHVDHLHRGERHRMGTRYHFDDLYGHWEANELKGHVLKIRALDDEGRSPWPDKYPSEWFKGKRDRAGTIIFNAQYQLDVSAMIGEIFSFDDCQVIDLDDAPKTSELKVFIGADLAIKESDQADQFAAVVIGVKGKINAAMDACEIYVLDFFAGHLRFSAQRAKLLALYDKWTPIRAGVEANAYQLAQVQELKEARPGAPFVPVFTDKDKVTRAWKISPIFETGRMFFVGRSFNLLIDQLVMFPEHKLKDGFDALEIAIRAAKKKIKKRRSRRTRTPGLI